MSSLNCFIPYIHYSYRNWPGKLEHETKLWMMSTTFKEFNTDWNAKFTAALLILVRYLVFNLI